jgi:hypothetical protein
MWRTARSATATVCLRCARATWPADGSAWCGRTGSLDATESGELLPLCDAEHVTGVESRQETGEPHAPRVAQPLNLQPVTACSAMDHREGEDHTIERPAGYADRKARRWDGWAEGQLRVLAPDRRTGRARGVVREPEPT